MRRDGADENSGGHKLSGARQQKEDHNRDEQSSTRIFGKKAPQERAVAVTNQEALDGYGEKR